MSTTAGSRCLTQKQLVELVDWFRSNQKNLVNKSPGAVTKAATAVLGFPISSSTIRRMFHTGKDAVVLHAWPSTHSKASNFMRPFVLRQDALAAAIQELYEELGKEISTGLKQHLQAQYEVGDGE